MDKNDKAYFRRDIREALCPREPIPEPQNYLGLNAAGFLLVALGHLVKAREKLDQEPPSMWVHNAHYLTRIATNHVRYALKLLDELKEETCEN